MTFRLLSTYTRVAVDDFREKERRSYVAELPRRALPLSATTAWYSSRVAEVPCFTVLHAPCRSEPNTVVTAVSLAAARLLAAGYSTLGISADRRIA